MSPVIERIRAKGYWDISIRPQRFQSDRVAYDALDDLLDQVVVRLRGWPVPFIDFRDPYLRGQDWIGQDIDARNVSHEEAWRFFRSGQFTQLRVISADRRVGAEATQVPRGAAGVIEVWEILFYLSEVVELAARLALSDAGDEQIRINTWLHGLENRLLVSGTPARELQGDYRMTAPSIQEDTVLQRDHLVAEPRQIAVAMTQRMLQRFGLKISEEVLSDYQQELTKGR